MARRIVDVLVPVALDHAYSYRVPPGLELEPEAAFLDEHQRTGGDYLKHFFHHRGGQVVRGRVTGQRVGAGRSAGPGQARDALWERLAPPPRRPRVRGVG